MKRVRVGRLTAAIASLVMVCAAGFARADDELRFGVVPQFEQRKLFGIWKPIVHELERRTGLRLRLVATLTVPDFEKELSAGNFDFVYANPFHILREQTRQGYEPLVRDALPLHGILVVAKNGPVQSLSDLQGKLLAFPSPNAIGASILLRADLERLFGIRMETLNVKTHSSVYLHVANGLTDAGGGVEKTLSEQDPAVRDAVRVLYTTRGIPSHPISAHPRVKPSDRENMRRALLDLAATAEGAALLAQIPMARPVPASMADYQPMADWGLDAYWVEGAK